MSNRPANWVLRVVGRFAGAWAVGLLIASTAAAQPTIPAEDASLARRLSSVNDLLDGQQWLRALEVLEQIQTAERDKVIRVRDDLYLNAAEYARLTLTRLPEPAVDAYLQQRAPQARRWLDAALRTHDIQQLEQIVERAFLTRAAEQALLTLGEWHLLEGDFDAARRAWTRLVPVNETDGSPPLLARYPAPQTPLPDVLARLVLCSILEGDTRRADWELSVFRRHFPDATGTLGGTEGTWTALLEEFRRNRADASPSEAPGLVTFAGDPRRTGLADAPTDVAAPYWTTPQELAPSPITPPQRNAAPPARIFPAVWNGLLLFADDYRVFAFDLETGAPAWLEQARLTPEQRRQMSIIYPPVAELAPVERFEWPVDGSAAATVTVAGGRLFARLGSPVTAWYHNELRRPPSRLVCLDLAAAQGRLQWAAAAEQLDPLLRFEGAPLVLGDKVYLLGRRGLAPTELHLVCFAERDGTFLWNRLVCSGPLAVPEGTSYASHLLLSTEDSRLFINTGLGVVAAYELDGRPLWFRLYDQPDPAATAERSAAAPVPETCAVADGVVYVQPRDGRELLALAAESGETVWTQPTTGEPLALLGFHASRLFLTGKRLECRDAADGTLLWQFAPRSADLQSAGMGFLTDTQVWWPTPTEILVFDQADGRLTRRIPLQPLFGVRGGQILSVGNRLLVAGPERITVFSDIREPPNREP